MEIRRTCAGYPSIGVEGMTITTAELARLRAIAEADKEGADGKAWDEAITPDTVIALCDKVEQLEQEATWLAKAAEMGGCNNFAVCRRCPMGDKRIKRCYWKDMREAAREAVEEGR